MKIYNHIAHSEAKQPVNENRHPTDPEAIKQVFHMTFTKCFNEGK